MSKYVFKVDAKTNYDNFIFYKDYRISILKNNLIRIEKDNKKVFNDNPTQIVLFRNFPKVNYNYEISENEIIIKLDGYELYFNGVKEESYILYNKQKLFLNNNENLGGTFSTVDQMDGNVYKGSLDVMPETRKVGLGVLSKNGVSIIDDTNSYCFDENLIFTHKNNNELDIYIFFYFNKYREAMKLFYKLSGFPPKLPKFVFGNWWSRFYDYTDRSYIHLMDSFINDNIPLTVATIDMDWHYSVTNGRNMFNDLGISEDEFILEKYEDKDNKYICEFWKDKTDPWSRGWTGYTFNKKLFPDYKKFLNDLKKRNLRVTLNVHPRQGIAFYEDMYDRCATFMNFDTSNRENIPFDFTDNRNREMHFKEVLNPYERDGVDFWWIDWQQGEKSRLPGLTPLWLCNHYFYLDNTTNHNRGVILSRFAGIGGHRYPLGFSGDTFQTFDSLRYLIKTTSQASNVGYSYWSHDIGGFMGGTKDGDLFFKFVQFGVFSPILRLHSECNETYSKEPRYYLKGYNELINKYLRFRHKMIPYIYSNSIKNHKLGTALLEPIYYYYPNDERSYKFSDSQYFFSKDLLVAPFSTRKDENDDNSIEVFFPKGNYYDLKYGYKYKGNKIKKITRELGDMPVFIKEGAFFILDSNNFGNDLSNPLNIDVITTFGNGKYKFYEDDDYSHQLVTTFKNLFVDKEHAKIEINIRGSKKVYQKDRVYNFKILNVYSVNDISIDNGEIYDVYTEGDCLEFKVKNLPYNQKVIISYSFNYQDDLFIKRRNILERLLHLDDNNLMRNRIYQKLAKASNVFELRKIINDSELLFISKEKLLEML